MSLVRKIKVASSLKIAGVVRKHNECSLSIFYWQDL